jgi:hypothetical protein
MRLPSKTLVGSMTRSSMTGSRPKSSVNGSADSRVRCSGDAYSADTGRPSPQELRGRPGHGAAVVAQAEVRQSPVEHALGVVNLAMAHEVEAIGGHTFSLRGSPLWTG